MKSLRAMFSRLWQSRKPQSPLTEAQLAQALEIIKARRLEEQGDGGAVFLSDMTEEEFADFERMEHKGWRPFYDRIKALWTSSED